MKLLSREFKNNQELPSRYTCDGENINPPLEILDVPQAAKSLVLIVTDPDVPSGEWTHWVVWNISPATREIKKDSLPENAVEGITSSGKPGYKGPCPEEGTHVYLFKLYAVDTILPPDENLKKKDIRGMIEGHIIEKTLLKGFYAKPQGENF